MNESLLELTTRAGRKYTYALKLNVALAVAKAHGNGGIFFTKSGNGQTFSIDLKNVISIEITEVGVPEINAEHHNCGKTSHVNISAVGAEEIKKVINSMDKQTDKDAFHPAFPEIPNYIERAHDSEFGRFLQGKAVIDSRAGEGITNLPNASKGNFKSDIETDLQNTGLDLVSAYNIKNSGEYVQRDLNKVLYKIDCKCGATYFARLFADTNFCACRECGERVFVDHFAAQVFGDNKESATLITNKYYVTRADSKPSREIV
jgi:hypothetical protein